MSVSSIPTRSDALRVLDTQTVIIDLLGRNVPFEEILVELCKQFRKHIEGSKASILLPTDDGTTLIPGLGLGLAINVDHNAPPVKIAEGYGTSGTAAFRRETVITADIAADPMWALWRDKALEAGIRACWAIPLIGSDDQLLGVLAILWPRAATPQPRESWLHEQFARITTPVIERYRTQQSVSQILADERRALAEDLHDDPIQVIAAVGLRLQLLQTSATPEQQAQLSTMQELVAGANERMRSLLFDLHPPTLDDDGLMSAVELYLEERLDPVDIHWELHDGLDAEPSAATASLAYRLASEALSNVAQHSHADRVDVTCKTSEGGLHVVIADDGVGCDIEAAIHGRAGHLGTVNSRFLAQRASGHWSIDSTPGEGTTVEFWLPIGQLS